MTDYTADQLRAERTRRKWTQRKFADIIGVSTSAVSAWENGEKTPTYNHMRRINEVFEHGANRDRVAELEVDVSLLRSELAALRDQVARLGLDAEAFRATVTELLATSADRVAGEVQQSEPQAGQ